MSDRTSKIGFLSPGIGIGFIFPKIVFFIKIFIGTCSNIAFATDAKPYCPISNATANTGSGKFLEGLNHRDTEK